MEEGLWDGGTISLVKILPDSGVYKQEPLVPEKNESISSHRSYTALLTSRVPSSSPTPASLACRLPSSSPAPSSLAARLPSSSPAPSSLAARLPSSSPAPSSLTCLVDCSFTPSPEASPASVQPSCLPQHQICIADSNLPNFGRKTGSPTTQVQTLNKHSQVQQKFVVAGPVEADGLLARIKQDTTLVKSAGDSRPAGGGKILRGVTGKLVSVPGRLVFNPVTGLVVSPNTEKEPTSSASPGRSSPDRLACTSTTHTTSSTKEVKEDEATRRYCLVCGDVASGFHYGVSSCEACKAFFKRTIQGNIEYTCPANSDCEINKRRRKACQACRFEKCLRKGMLKEGVRLDRVRGGRQKYRRLTENSPYGEIQSSRRVSLEDNHILECLSSSEPETLSVQEFEVDQVHADLRSTAVLADIYDRELVLTIGWAKQVPGFSDLSLNDQMKLLQSGWTEVLTLTLVYRSLPKLGKLNFASDYSLTESQASHTGLHKFFLKCMSIVDRLESLGVTREEYLILKGLVLTNTDCHLEDISVIHSLRESIMSSLQDCVCAIRSGDSRLMVQQLLLVLPSLREADHLLRTFWSTVRKNGTVPMNRLLIEMLETN